MKPHVAYRPALCTGPPAGMSGANVMISPGAGYERLSSMGRAGFETNHRQKILEPTIRAYPKSERELSKSLFLSVNTGVRNTCTFAFLLNEVHRNADKIVETKRYRSQSMKQEIENGDSELVG